MSEHEAFLLRAKVAELEGRLEASRQTDRELRRMLRERGETIRELQQMAIRAHQG